MRTKRLTIALGTVYALAALAASQAATSTATAAPVPKLSVQTWQLDFSFDDPQKITVTSPGASESQTYWYMLFTVQNNTGKDVTFFPQFRLVTDSLQSINGGDEIPPAAYEAIFERHRSQYPFITEPFKITGPILQGEANARSSVVVFKQFDARADKFTIFVSGLSGDRERKPNPGFDRNRPERGDNVKFFVLRRTLAIEYGLPGDEQTRSSAKPVRKSRKWVFMDSLYR
ncbi:MAG: hypothetical protein ACPGXK_04245 [Phycisphaerae bacterium]